MEQANDVKIVKEELYDADAMDGLSSHDGVSVDVKKLLKAYRKQRVDGNKVQVVYEYGKDWKKLKVGRQYPQKGIGLQNFPSDVRNALSKKYYFDIDCVNSQPVILVQLCKTHGWNCTQLEKYVNERASKLSDIMKALDCTRDEAKEICLVTLFGGKVYKKGVPQFIKDLQDEMTTLAINMQAHYPDIFKVCKNKPNPGASCVANVVQNIEFNLLLCIDKALREKGRNMAVYIHDGGLVERNPGEEYFPSDILLYAQEQVKEKLNYNITLAEKKMEHTFVFQHSIMKTKYVSKKEYDAMRERFELEHFYCKETNTIVTITPNGITHTSKSDANASFASYNFHKNVDNVEVVTEFIPLWLQDPIKKIIDKLVFSPSSSKVDENCYNLYNGMKGSKIPDEKSGEEENIVKQFQLLLYQNAGENEEMYQYMTKWFASLIQRPHVIPGVALILINQLQGTGKDTLLNFIGKEVVGYEYFKNIKNVETELFDTHSVAFDKTLFMKCEEVNGTLNRKFSDMLKAMITATSATINPKGHSKYTIDAFPHIVMTTNNPVPVKVERGDRRFCISYTGSKFVGNRDFWTETYRLFDLPDAGYFTYEYLRSIPLDDFIIQDFPKNDYHDMLSETEVSSEQQYFNQCEPFTDMKPSNIHANYVEYCKENGLTPKAVVHFSRSMAPLISTGAIKKRTLHGCSVYTKE
jgi:hypothetical protein